MRRFRILTCCIIALIVFLLSGSVTGEGQSAPIAPRGILIGEKWHSVTRELMEVYPDQNTLNLGEKGIRTVQFWAEVKNCAGREFTWVIRYANGMQDEILTQRIRYDRFRMYIEKTFRRNIWNAQSRKLVDVTGPCRILLVDKAHPDRPVAEKAIVLK